VMTVVAIVVGYLLGAISFSYLYGKLVKGIDIREHGSGNAGATNTLRVLGKGPGILVLLLDIAKGIAAVWIARWLGSGEWTPVLAGLAAIVGHNWPIYFGFRGGKGIATTIGVIASLGLLPAALSGAVAIAAIAVTRYVSLGSLLFTGLLPIAILATGRPIEVFWASLLIAVFAFVRHRGNIVKLAKGTENKLGRRA
jgi:glycerol-3-phosphate acyltransferase PlsY